MNMRERVKVCFHHLFANNYVKSKTFSECFCFSISLFVSIFLLEIQKLQSEPAKEDKQTHSEESQNKEYLKSLFEILLLLVEQNIPPSGPSEACGFTNFQELIEYQKNCGDEICKKKYKLNKESNAQFMQMIEILEKFIHKKLMEDVKQSGFFSVITDDLVKISGDWYLPVFLRYVDQSDSQQERFGGFLSLSGDGESFATELMSELLQKWGLDMKQCRGQAHSSGIHSRKIRMFAAKLMEEYPKAILTLRSNFNLNLSLASGMNLPAVQLVLTTLKKTELFFSESPLLQLELDNAISIYHPDKEETAKELKEVCRTNWTTQSDVFEVAAQILEPLLLCVDSVHDNEELRWSDEVAHTALDISKALTDFDFVMALTVLKNTLALTQAFGTNLQGKPSDSYFAGGSLKAVLDSLKEVSDNIDVYHEFWTDEAINLATSIGIPVKVPRSFLRKHHLESGTIRLESHYRDHLSVPVVKHVISELNRLFGEDHLKALKCLSLIPLVLNQSKDEPKAETVGLFQDDIPSAGVFSEELHCWQVKWSKKATGENLPTDIHEAIHLADLKFFPNMLVIFRLLSILPSLSVKDSSVAYKQLQMYIKNTPDKFKSKSLAFLNMNNDMCDLDAAVETYTKAYPDMEMV